MTPSIDTVKQMNQEQLDAEFQRLECLARLRHIEAEVDRLSREARTLRQQLELPARFAEVRK